VEVINFNEARKEAEKRHSTRKSKTSGFYPIYALFEVGEELDIREFKNLKKIEVYGLKTLRVSPDQELEMILNDETVIEKGDEKISFKDLKLNENNE
jgi:hypothetical protein